MNNFTRSYSISDFIEWDTSKLLQLSPEFQRRSVWSDKAKSYLIDTILRGKLMPKIIIQQKLVGQKTVRVVVDGQQRIRAILDYYHGLFKISKAHNKQLANYIFQTLPDGLDKQFLKYELGVDVLFETPYAELLDIFARLNSYTVKLNTQELFNAKYLGYFKQTVYKLGFKYVNFYLEANIISKAQVTRMAEAELTADIFIALLDGVQTNKQVESFYKKYDDVSTGLEDIEKRFDKVMTYLGSIYKPAELKLTNYSRIHLFYSLFTAIAHMQYGIEGIDARYHKPISEKSIPKIRAALDNVSALYDEVVEDSDMDGYSKEFKEFVNYTRRGTTDTTARRNRTKYLCKMMIKSL